MILVAVLIGWAAASLPVAVVLGMMLRAMGRADAATKAERDELIRTIIATAGDGNLAMRLRATRPEVGEQLSPREMLRRQAEASAAALSAMEDQFDGPRRTKANEIIPVGMGGE